MILATSTLMYLMSVVFGAQSVNYMCSYVPPEPRIVVTSTFHHADGTVDAPIEKSYYGPQEVIPVMQAGPIPLYQY